TRCDHVTIRLRTLPSEPFRDDADAMSASVMWGFILIGAGAIVAGILGLLLPRKERLAAVFALVIGAGVGVATLAIGGHGSPSQSAAETAFLVASALGFVAVVVSSAAVWIRMGQAKRPKGHPDVAAPPPPSDPPAL